MNTRAINPNDKASFPYREKGEEEKKNILLVKIIK